MPARFALVALALTLAACTVIPEEERALLSGDIDCDSAEQDIAALDAARPTDARKARVLASSLGAGGLAVMVARSDVEDRREILSGRYGDQIDARIALVRETCEV
ncbi:hypothetical protein [Roseitranquillus sediminis]|uniref:hypothetical protein n=1 Tax=Roseitranquillus sediminis TaxID=2809051 RepID=UPI001D0CC86A|nr:hypothetical protein [Roseitranquillus sediminis]MBM9593685.1 hypothetical protein [Roseitranquillus sediminis]